MRPNLATVAPFPTMSHTYGNCLLSAIASIEPACVMNFASTQTQSHNGISAAESNSNVQHDSQRPTDTSFRLCHYLAQNIEEYAKVNERWLCRQGFPDGGGHWWAVSFDLTGNAPVVDVQARDFVLLLKNIDLEKSCRKFDNITWFRLARCPHKFIYLWIDRMLSLRLSTFVWGRYSSSSDCHSVRPVCHMWRNFG